MLTIQPGFSQRFQVRPMFTGRHDYAVDAEIIGEENFGDTAEFTNDNPRNLPVLASTYATPDANENKEEEVNPEEDLKGLQDDIDLATKGIKKLSDKMPSAAKSTMNGLCLLGGGAVVGLSTKFGWSESTKVIKKIIDSPTIKKFNSNVEKVFTKIGDSFAKLKETNMYKNVANKFSEWGDRFAKTKFGGKVTAFFKRVNESEPVQKIKAFFGKTKNIKSANVADTTGDIVSVATGVSTTAAGAISDKKKKPEAKAKAEEETKTESGDNTSTDETDADDEDDSNVVD